jgi:hypothetical protein
VGAVRGRSSTVGAAASLSDEEAGDDLNRELIGSTVRGELRELDQASTTYLTISAGHKPAAR